MLSVLLGVGVVGFMVVEVWVCTGGIIWRVVAVVYFLCMWNFLGLLYERLIKAGRAAFARCPHPGGGRVGRLVYAFVICSSVSIPPYYRCT